MHKAIDLFRGKFALGIYDKNSSDCEIIEVFVNVCEPPGSFMRFLTAGSAVRDAKTFCFRFVSGRFLERHGQIDGVYVPTYKSYEKEKDDR